MRAIIIFVKNPELGKVKSRLANSIGEEGALKVYKYLLEFTHRIIKNTNADQLFLFHNEKIIEANKWSILNCENKVQISGSLGEKMKNSFEFVFSKGFDNVVILGSDCLEITSKIINEGFSKLENTNVVIGPAKDGGYYLLGLNKVIPSLFKNMPWSASDLLVETIKKITKEKLNYKLLPVLSDVDYLEDLEGKLDWTKL
tara:strand:- start:886 stop:1485 length:600 start_codon:yes stop_codon:yes gene_type:complete